MKRLNFLKSLAAGMAAVAIAPSLLAQPEKRIIRFSNASNCTITIPHDLPNGFEVHVKGATVLRNCTITSSNSAPNQTLVFKNSIDVQNCLFENLNIRFAKGSNGNFSHNTIDHAGSYGQSKGIIYSLAPGE